MITSLTHKYDKELADSVLEVTARANKEIINELRGDGNMCNALLEIMAPEIEERVEERVEERIREREMKAEIIGGIRMLQQGGHADEEIKEMLMKNYDLSLEEIEEYLK